jgi:hypothetical protein
MKTSSNERGSYVGCSYTARDLAILVSILDKKYAITPQIHQLHFPHSRNQKVCTQRMQILRERGLVRCIEQAHKRGEGRKPYIWALTEKGAQLVAFERGIDPSLIDVRPWADEEYNLHIKHLLLTTDVHIALMQACAHTGITLDSWIDERELRSIQMMDAVHIQGLNGEEWEPPIPDATFALQIGDKRGVYRLEVDRATVDIDPSLYEKRSIIGKVRKYLAWEASEHYRLEHQTRPLRVLFIVKGARRLSNMKAATEKALREKVQWRMDAPEDEKKKKQQEMGYLGRRFRFLSLDQVQIETLVTAPIWQVAGSDSPQTILE